jgi:hypothetical protein
VDSYAGRFSLAIPVAGHGVGTMVRVTVSARHPSRLVLDFSEHDQVVADACVLLCGHVGAVALLKVGYTGPLVRRPAIAAWRARKPSDGAAAAPTMTEIG